MKNIKTATLRAFIVLMLSLMFFTSCSNDDSADAGNGAPVIESVMPSGYDEDGKVLPLNPVEIVSPKSYYIIHGKGFLTTEKVYFNDYDTYFRSTFVTDTDIVILVDENTPFVDVSNELKVVTKTGTAVYNISVAPPPPTIYSFNSINAVEGDEVTIKGKFFLNPIVSLAKTATLPEVPLTVVSSTLDQIVVKIPANANFRNLAVTTTGGGAVSAEALGTAIYDDKMYAMQWGGPWAGTGVNFDYTVDTYQGEKAWQWTFGTGYQGGNWGFNSIDLTPYKAFRIAVKGTKNGTVNLSIGGSTYALPITTEWVYREISISDLGNPASFSILTLQEATGDGNIVLFDDLGFVLK